jgi:hypothetical protein
VYYYIFSGICLKTQNEKHEKLVQIIRNLFKTQKIRRLFVPLLNARRISCLSLQLRYVYSERLIQSFLFPVHRVCIIIYLYVVRYIFVNMCMIIKKITVLGIQQVNRFNKQSDYISYNILRLNTYFYERRSWDMFKDTEEHTIIRRRTDNGMTKIIMTTRQTMIHKILHRKLKIGQHVLVLPNL